MLVTIGTLAHMGGAERQALYLVEHLARRGGCSVELLAFEDGSALRPILDGLGVRTHAFPYYFRWPKTRRAPALGRLALYVRNVIRPDALLPFVGIHSKTMAMIWPYTNARFCWWNQQDEGRDLTGTEVEGRILRKVPCITSNSDAGRDFLATTYSLNPNSILVYNNGTPRMQPSASSGRWRAHNPVGDRRIVTMLANITEYKDHSTLLDAWAILLQKVPRADRPVLVLAGHLRESAVATRLKLQAFDLGLSNEDVVFAGPVTDVEDLLADSTFVVHSSVMEGCPNAVCEAMAMRKAVVATDIPGTRQALGPNSQKWLAKPHDAQDFAARMLKMLSDDVSRREAENANLARVRSEFSIEGMNRFFVQQIERGLGYSLQ